MNETIRLLHSHRSERSYKSDPIPDDILDSIIESAHLAPTSINSQQVSVVVVRDAASRERIAEIAGGQPWIAQAPVFLALVADLNKTRVGVEKVGATQQLQHSIEGVISASTDVGIALATIMIAARSHGLGIVPIGGIRRNPEEMIKLLGLPEYTFPVAGVAMGYVDQPSTQKPRLAIESFRHEELYHSEALRPAIDAYDVTLPEYWESISRTDGMTWSQNTAVAYSIIYFPKVKPIAASQGFSCED
jgi:FMN reductase [NAD(P)H]